MADDLFASNSSDPDVIFDNDARQGENTWILDPLSPHESEERGSSPPDFNAYVPDWGPRTNQTMGMSVMTSCLLIMCRTTLDCVAVYVMPLENGQRNLGMRNPNMHLWSWDLSSARVECQQRIKTRFRGQIFRSERGT